MNQWINQWINQPDFTFIAQVCENIWPQRASVLNGMYVFIIYWYSFILTVNLMALFQSTINQRPFAATWVTISDKKGLSSYFLEKTNTFFMLYYFYLAFWGYWFGPFSCKVICLSVSAALLVMKQAAGELINIEIDGLHNQNHHFSGCCHWWLNPSSSEFLFL